MAARFFLRAFTAGTTTSVSRQQLTSTSQEVTLPAAGSYDLRIEVENDISAATVPVPTIATGPVTGVAVGAWRGSAYD